MDSGPAPRGASRNDGEYYFFGGAGHGRCAPRNPSNALAMPSTPRSSKRRPTICTPIGKPFLSKPPLIEAAGFYAMFHGIGYAACFNGFRGSLRGGADPAGQLT